MTGYGTVTLRIDHELVGRVLAEKHRRRHEVPVEGEGFRIAKTRARGRG